MALDILEELLSTRLVTGNAAITLIENTLDDLSENDSIVIQKVLDRDLKINMGRVQINKVFKNLIVKPVYMRCGIGKKKHIHNGKIVKSSYDNINFKEGAIIQKKADGTYREFTVLNNKVSCVTRSGESHNYPNIFNIMKDWPDGVYLGELTVSLDDVLLDIITPNIAKSDKKNGTNDVEIITKSYNNSNFYILPRSVGNGLINSDNIPYSNLILDLWDRISIEDYKLASDNDKKHPAKTQYNTRLKSLNNIISDSNAKGINLIETHTIHTLEEALIITCDWMNNGFEGGILKDNSMVFENRTSKYQLKIKLEIDLDVRCTGFTKGNKNTKREKTFGAMMFETDDGLIIGQCSGFNDNQLEDFNVRRDELIGKIFTVTCNDIVKGRGNKHHALSHPRFDQFRNDKESTDTLERAFDIKEMSMQLK
jgi:D-ribose pyranose/furanose isomerase RbsD